eukprot:COSAG02_NODE_2150_length_9660_cov_45.377889_8_plen_84_part_00
MFYHGCMRKHLNNLCTVVIAFPPRIFGVRTLTYNRTDYIAQQGPHKVCSRCHYAIRNAEARDPPTPYRAMFALLKQRPDPELH